MSFKYKEVYLTEKDTQAEMLAPIVGCKHTQKWMPCYNSDRTVAVVPLQGHVSTLLMPAEYDEAYKDWNDDTILCFPKEFKRKPAKGKEAIFNRAVEHIRNAEKVIIATDFDAEGAAMAMNIIKAASAEDRIDYMLHMGSMHPESLKKALKDRPYIDYKSLAKAGLSRAEIDWAEGMSYSRALTIHLAKKRVKLNFGGLKTPIISMVVERDLQFENHKDNKFFFLEGRARFQDKEFKVSFYKKEEVLDEKSGKKKEVKNKEYATKELVEELVEKIKQSNSFKVSSFIKREGKTNPDRPFTQSSLQVSAGEKLNLEPEQVLALTQKGYLNDKINSYPRTEIPYIANKEFEDVPIILKNLSAIMHKEIIDDILSKPLMKRPTAFDIKETEVTAHGAIIPTITEFKSVVPSLKPIEQKFFSIIANRYIENFMPPAIDLNINGEIHVFDNVYASFTETVPLEAGYKILQKPDFNKTIAEYQRVIPEDLKEGSEVLLGGFKINEGKTKPKPRFTQTSLIKALESVANLYPDDKLIQEILKDTGIGTGATRAPTLASLFEVDKEGEEPWFIKKGKQVISTDKARKLVSVLPKELVSPVKRAYFQKDIRAVEKGEMSIEELRQKVKADMIENIEMIKDYGKDPKNVFAAKKKEIISLGKCPICKNGDIYEKGKVYMCSSAIWKKEGPDESPKWINEGCDYTIFKEALKKLGKNTIGKLEVKSLLKNGKFTAKLVSAKTNNEYQKDVIVDPKWGVKVDFNSNPGQKKGA